TANAPRDHPATPACRARASQVITRFGGMFEHAPSNQLADALLVQARVHGGGDARASAAVLAAEASAAADLSFTDAARIVDRVANDGDPITLSTVLDTLTGVQLLAGDPVAATRTAQRRVDLLTLLPLEPDTALELKDALHNGVFAALGAGD